MKTHLVLAGAGHAHLHPIHQLPYFLKANCRVTVVSPATHHYYSGMGPGLLGGMYRMHHARFNVRALTERGGAAFVRDRVVGIDPGASVLHLESGDHLSYDLVSFNIGSKVQEHTRVQRMEENCCITATGKAIPFDMALVATGVTPPSVFRDSELSTGPGGGLLLNRFLQSVAHENIFGTGDCIYFGDQPLDRIGVHAVRQAPLLTGNLLAAVRGRTLQPYRPRRTHLLILNMGDGTGVARYERFVWHGPVAFMLKNAIDRRFVRRYST